MTYSIKNDPHRVSDIITDDSGKYIGAIIAKPKFNADGHTFYIVAQKISGKNGRKKRVGKCKRKKVGKSLFIKGREDYVTYKKDYMEDFVLKSMRFTKKGLEAEILRESGVLEYPNEPKGTIIYTRPFKPAKMKEVSNDPKYDGWLVEAQERKVKVRLRGRELAINGVGLINGIKSIKKQRKRSA
ncbi:hypothetical protein GOV14_01235 [Candidatus Pacearchaeota archaeon]|nr:hypothetical protein [Candidatus Pacearchaeota archaeon]